MIDGACGQRGGALGLDPYSRRLEHHRTVTGTTAWADQPGFQAGQGEIWSPGHQQCLHIQLCPKHASTGAVRIVDTAHPPIAAEQQEMAKRSPRRFPNLVCGPARLQPMAGGH
jgi:hypothetical protein